MNISVADIKKVFGEDKYKINYAQSKKYGHIQDKYEILDKYGKDCIIFHPYINEKINCLHIDSLHRCSESSGTHLLSLIERFAKRHKIQCISLWDASRLELCENISIKLAPLYIVTTGHSWYNKLGYKSPDYEAERVKNGALIQSDFVTKLSHYYNNDNERVYNTIIEITNIIEPDAEEPNVSGTVQEVFSKLRDYLKHGDNCEYLSVIVDLVNIFSQDIMYDIEVLEKHITIPRRNKSASASKRVSKRKTIKTIKTIKTV